MKIKIKKLHPEAVVPKYAKEGDAAVDLVAVDNGTVTSKFIEYSTGIAVQIPEGHVGLIFPRSSVTNTNLMLKNAVGVIDSGYRGEIKFRFCTLNSTYYMGTYSKGDRIGQLIIMPIPTMEFEEVDDLDSSQRGSGGWGSSGK